MSWKHLMIVVGVDPVQVNKATGALQYPAVQVVHEGVRLSYITGIYESQQRRGEKAVTVVEDPKGFYTRVQLRCGELHKYVEVLNAAASLEHVNKEQLAKANLARYREIGRRVG